MKASSSRSSARGFARSGCSVALLSVPGKVPMPRKVPLLTSGSRRDSPRLLLSHESQQRGAAVTLTVTLLMVIALLLLTGPFELARVIWLLSQSV